MNPDTWAVVATYTPETGYDRYDEPLRGNAGLTIIAAGKEYRGVFHSHCRECKLPLGYEVMAVGEPENDGAYCIHPGVFLADVGDDCAGTGRPSMTSGNRSATSGFPALWRSA